MISFNIFLCDHIDNFERFEESDGNTKNRITSIIIKENVWLNEYIVIIIFCYMKEWLVESGRIILDSLASMYD